MPTTLRAAFVAACSIALLAIGVWHLVDGPATERMFAKAANVRAIGAALLLLAIPCLFFRGWYFWTLAALLLFHGGLRFFAPQSNIRLQKSAYPRWVHGCIISTAAVAMWLIFAKYAA